MKFTQSHEWARLEGSIATIGITDYAQKELGDIVFVELPKVGAVVKAKEECVVLESTKAAADIYSPLSGKVTAVNTVLLEYPEKINQSAEKEGWLFQILVDDASEYEALMDQREYFSLISQ